MEYVKTKLRENYESELREETHDCGWGCRDGDGGEGGLLDDVLQDARWAAIFPDWVRETRCRWICDNQGRGSNRRRLQDPGLVPEDARRSAYVIRMAVRNP